MHKLIADLTEMLNLTPEQQFRVSAMIKRNVHDEKASVFRRYHHYSLGAPIFDRTDPENPVHTGKYESGGNDWLTRILKAKADQHAEWAKMTDEEVITWSIGTHKYVQKVEPCSVCKVELTGKPYGRVVDKNGNNTFCPEHYPKDEDEKNG